MIPETVVSITELEQEEVPSLTYGIDFEKGRMAGMIDNHEAVVQMVRKVLSTERYAYVVYTSQFGVTLENLIGQDYDYVVPEIEREIKDALSVDDRILSVTDFVFNKTALDSLEVTFMVNSIYGGITITTEVNT